MNKKFHAIVLGLISFFSLSAMEMQKAEGQSIVELDHQTIMSILKDGPIFSSPYLIKKINVFS